MMHDWNGVGVRTQTRKPCRRNETARYRNYFDAIVSVEMRIRDYIAVADRSGSCEFSCAAPKNACFLRYIPLVLSLRKSFITIFEVF